MARMPQLVSWHGCHSLCHGMNATACVMARMPQLATACLMAWMPKVAYPPEADTSIPACAKCTINARSMNHAAEAAHCWVHI
eukprot:scaffold134411_cov21-Tisochrysis_lutea.AAC.2